MYEKITADVNAEQVLNVLRKSNKKYAPQCMDKLWLRMFSVISELHALGWRHGDVVPKNFLLRLPAPIESLTPADIEKVVIYLIDYDKISKIANLPQWMKNIILLVDIFSLRYRRYRYSSREAKLMMDYLQIQRSLLLRITFRILKARCARYTPYAKESKGV